MALLKLTEAQEAFVQDILNGMDEVEAFRNNYSTTGLDDRKTRYRAKQLLQNDKVQKRLQALILDRDMEAIVDKKFVIDLLKKTSLEKYGTQIGIKATELLGKHLGLFADKHIIQNEEHIKAAEEVWQNIQREKAGEEVLPLSDKAGGDKDTFEIIEFEPRDGTND